MFNIETNAVDIDANINKMLIEVYAQVRNKLGLLGGGLGVTKSEKMDKMNWDTESVEKSDLPPSRTSAEPGQCGKSRRVPQTPASAAVR